MSAAALLCLVVAISDGDTLKARCGEPGAYEQVTIRLSAIDAPERRQPFGDRSRQALAALCFQVEAKITPKSKDRYKRTVADVECRGQDAGQHMVREGWAWVYSAYDRGYAHLYPLQDAARSARTGIWHDEHPVAPWEWRRNRRTSEG